MTNQTINTSTSNTSTSNTSNAPTINTPTISSSAMLVELSIGVWTGRKKDKKASEEVTTSNNAAVGVAAVSKKLLGDCAELDAVQKFVANTRNAHYASTMPWSDTGLRLLPTANFFNYQQQMTALQNEFYSLTDKFLQAYEWEISQAQVKLGDLFNPDEYPTTDRLREKFRFNMCYIPLPDANDWRVDMEKETVDVLRSGYESFYSAQLNNAMKDVWQRLFDRLSKMSERLDYADDTNKKIFRDSLVDNVIDMVDILRDFNVTGDSQMEGMRLRLEQALRGVTPDGLREDAHLRAETKRSVDEMIKALPSLDI